MQSPSADPTLTTSNRTEKSLLVTVAILAIIANDGIEALMMASKKQYDVILMDVQIPNMSGIDGTKKIRRLQGPVAGCRALLRKRRSSP
tara:strand:- start:195 stop:461 length:267 start_codon:yes stop_codon:yes gene_type:complete